MRTSKGISIIIRRSWKRGQLTLGEACKARLVEDGEVRLLLDAAVAGGDANVVQSKLAEVKLLGEVLGCDPVHLLYRVSVGAASVRSKELTSTGRSKLRRAGKMPTLWA